ncbi:hypothetical protein F5Y11DRAFT_313406 [Daldinia sp. FL1419]|nr:hypothetical protein F5Y11DRAFT_313406 [Daldinia sp. FL1419]
MEKNMRLRLVVRRDGLPEERLMWNISLQDDPTISKLIEKVNEIFPLEIGQRGLEDYVVELRDQDGTSFECLHFQPVCTVLKPDDRVFIRALDRDDGRRRRISGRHQISSRGKHLVDGIPFGRRLLGTPISRPSIDPPRKRRKISSPQETADDSIGDEDTPVLLLTNGERLADKSATARVNFSPGFDFSDAEVEDGDFNDDAEVEDEDTSSRSDEFDQQGSEILSDEDDLEQELRDLVEDNAVVENEEPEDPRISSRRGHDKVSALLAAFPSAPVSICEKVLATAGDDLKSAYDILVSGFEPQLSESALLAGRTSKAKRQRDNLTNNIVATNPKEDNADITHYGEELSEDDNDKHVSEFIRQFDYRGLPPGSITSGKGLAQMAAISTSFDDNEVSAEGETASATLNGHKTSPEKTIEDNTSSDISSSSSSSDSEDSEVTSDIDSDDDSDDVSDDDSDDVSDDDSDNGSDDGSDDDSDEDVSQDSSDDENENINSDDSYGRLAGSSPKSPRRDMSSDSDSESGDSDDSDEAPEEISLRRRPSNVLKSKQKGFSHNKRRQIRHDIGSSDSNDTTSEDNSDEDSSAVESDSPFENEGAEESSANAKTNGAYVQTSSTRNARIQSSQLLPPPPPTPPSMVPQAQLVPPGAGNERTKKRNARRRAANKAKKLAQQSTITNTTSTGEEAESAIMDEKALFEAKRQELLNAIANGGVEVGPRVRFDELPRPSTATKRKFDEHNESSLGDTHQDASVMIPTDESVVSSGSVQKKARIDMGAGRRLLFGALGLRNPKTKEDESKLRTELMRDIRPLGNPRLDQTKDSSQHINENDLSVQDDIDSWKDKIVYRAVECCYDGIELSEPPFPFAQRWDPQQQSSWSQKKNKRGGQSKRAQRNSAHFYQDTHSGKKRKHGESDIWDEGAYDDTFDGVDEYTNDADVELNYDDTGSHQPHESNAHLNDTSQFTDMDDLPSLPSDLSALPALRPGEVQVGMVITWQQWSCSSATSWQPQLSNVTGVVVRIDDDATGLEVCLAKRDRYLDRNQKKYDENTGQRIYDKFEAPDLDDDDEDEGEDEGFRTIGFAEMQQPRILQQPLSTMVNSEKPDADNSPPKASHNARSEPPIVPIERKAGLISEQERSSTREPNKEDAPNAAIIEVPASGPDPQRVNTSTSGQPCSNSPSQQLYENTSQATDTQSHLPVQNPSGRNTDLDDPATKLSIEVPELELPSIRQSSAPLFDSHEDEVVAGTPRVVRSKAMIPPSSVSSARSGRQLDYTLHMEVTEPDSLKITEDGVSDAEYQQDLESGEDVTTPTPQSFHHKDSTIGQDTTTQKTEASSLEIPSSPSSLSSINTVWCTALTSRNTQTPSKSQSQSQSLPTYGSQNVRTQSDQDYEEAMRKLDNVSDDRTSSSRIPDSFGQGNQGRASSGVEDRVFKASPESPPIKTSPPPPRKQKVPKGSSQFILPSGTQVVEISSDSEPVYTENYADDEVDGTYCPDTDSLPKGSGWVHKKIDGKNRNARSVTAPIRHQLSKRRKFISSSQGPLTTSPSTSMSVFTPVKPRRKTSSRF